MQKQKRFQLFAPLGYSKTHIVAARLQTISKQLQFQEFGVYFDTFLTNGCIVFNFFIYFYSGPGFIAASVYYVPYTAKTKLSWA